jgi:hypothetical protein
MHRHPPTAADTHRTYFSLITIGTRYPDTGPSLDSGAWDIEPRTRPDDDFLEVSQVSVNVRIETIQIQNWVPNYLSWTMIGDVSTAVTSHERSSLNTQFLLAYEEVSIISTPTQGKDRWMLHQKANMRQIFRCF